jgi:SAM-dependent methyltransferase
MRNPGHEWYEEAPRCVLRDKVRNNLGLHWRHRQFFGTPLSHGARILDIGCGVGVFAAHCERKGYQATGIDFDHNAIAVAREHFGLQRAYALTLEEFTERREAQGFDVVSSFEVLEHQDDPAGFISKIKRLLKPAGCIALSVPNRNRWSMLPVEDLPPNHLTRWDVTALTRFLESQGLDVVQVIESPISLRSAQSVVSGKLNDWVPGLGRLKRGVVSRTAKLVAHAEESTAHTAASGYRVLRRFWNGILLAPSACLVPYARLSEKRGDCIYCLATMRSDKTK